MLYPVESVWCCLHPIERGMNTLLVTAYITPPGYVEQATFDLWYAALDPINSSLRKASFIDEYGLLPDVIIISEEIEIPIYRFIGSWWPALFSFFSTHDTSCPTPCSYITFPE